MIVRDCDMPAMVPRARSGRAGPGTIESSASAVVLDGKQAFPTIVPGGWAAADAIMNHRKNGWACAGIDWPANSE